MSFNAAAAAAGEYETAREFVLQQKWNDALPLLKKLNEEEPESITIAKDLAQVLLRLNRREEALFLLRQHKLQKPLQIAARSFLSKESFRLYQQGLDWFTKRSFSQACERFEKALEKDQGHADILLRLAQCEILDGNGDLGGKLLDQLDRIHGKSVETGIWRAKSALLRGKPEESLTLYAGLSGEMKSLSEPLGEWATLGWGEALIASNQKSAASSLFDADAKRAPQHLAVTLASLRLRASSAESPNQFLQLAQEIDALDKKILLFRNNPPKKLREFIPPLFDVEALQRGVAELREQIRPQLPVKAPPKG